MTLRYGLRRLWCRSCGIRTERVGFADPHARLTRRFRQRIGLDCQSMPTSHAAVRHAVSWGAARRAERAFLEAWDRTRPKHRPRYLGVDEIQRGKGQHFWTVLSDLVRSEVIGLQKDRSEESFRTLLNDRLDQALARLHRTGGCLAMLLLDVDPDAPEPPAPALHRRRTST